jgi:hypothetical protein
MLSVCFFLSPVFQFFLAISEPPPCLQLLPKTLRPLDVFLLLTICGKASISLGNRLLFKTSSALIYVFQGLGF